MAIAVCAYLVVFVPVLSFLCAKFTVYWIFLYTGRCCTSAITCFVGIMFCFLFNWETPNWLKRFLGDIRASVIIFKKPYWNCEERREINYSIWTGVTFRGGAIHILRKPTSCQGKGTFFINEVKFTAIWKTSTHGLRQTIQPRKFSPKYRQERKWVLVLKYKRTDIALL